MNPNDYVFYTLNARQYLVNPETFTAVKREEKTKVKVSVFFCGLVVGVLLQELHIIW